LGILRTPTQTFEEEMRTSTWQKGVFHWLLMLVLSFLYIVIAMSFAPESDAETLQSVFTPAVLGATFLSSLVSNAGGALLVTLVLFGCMRFAKGKGSLVQTFHIQMLLGSFASIFAVLVGFVLFGLAQATGGVIASGDTSPVYVILVFVLVAALIIYSEGLYIKALKALGQFSTGRAISTIVYQIILSFLLSLALMAPLMALFFSL